jgi:hypothetical protein
MRSGRKDGYNLNPKSRSAVSVASRHLYTTRVLEYHPHLYYTQSISYNNMSAPVEEYEAPSTDLITLTRHILSQQFALGEKATGDLTMLLIGIQVSGLVLPFGCDETTCRVSFCRTLFLPVLYTSPHYTSK